MRFIFRQHWKRVVSVYALHLDWHSFCSKDSQSFLWPITACDSWDYASMEMGGLLCEADALFLTTCCRRSARLGSKRTPSAVFIVLVSVFKGSK